MGAFGVGPLENDEGLDWLIEYTESPESSVRMAVETVIKCKGRISATKAARGIAACYLVSLNASKKIPKKIEALLEASGISRELISKARDQVDLTKCSTALDMILSEKSELAVEWDESGKASEWRKSVQAIQQLISGT